MLFKQRFLPGLANGTVTLAFRRWDRPRVRPGTLLRTAVGILAVDAVDVVARVNLTERDARRAGFASRAELLAELDAHGDGTIYRVVLRFAGADPRTALRAQRAVSDDELAAVRRRLARLDAASRGRPWTLTVLQLIRERPGVRAADLAPLVGRDRLRFKADVRKLKELGLTESLEIGYRLSPRGRTVLGRLHRR